MAKTMEERRREMNAKYGRKEKEKNTFSLPVAESEEAKKENASRMDELRREMNEKYNLVSKVNDKFIDDFMSDVNSLSKGAQNTYDGITWGTAASTYDAQAKTIADLRARSGAIRQYLKKNKDTIDPKEYESWMTELDSTGEWMNSYLDSFSQAKKHYGQWKTEDEYNGWLDYQDSLDFDLEAGKAEIDRLQGYAETWEDAVSQISILETSISRKEHDLRYSLSADKDKLSKEIAEEKARLESYKSVVNQIDGAKVIEDLEDKKAYYALAEKNQQAYEYLLLANAGDFAEKSKYVSTYRGGEEYNAWSNMYTDTGYDDIMYDYINGDEKARSIKGLNDTQSNATLVGVDKGERKEMTPEEISIFNYIYATEGSEAAYEYVEFLTEDLNARQRATTMEKWAKMAEEDPVGSSVFSVIEAPLKGISYIGQAADYLDDGKIDQNAGYNKFSYVNSAIRNQVSKTVEDKWGGVGSFAYQTGMSMADFLFTTAITGGNSALSLGIMGTGAAADTVISAKDRGLSDDQAFALGTIAGVAEVITEKISLDALLDATQLGKSALGYVIKNVFAEGSEEVGSSLINLVADVLISKDKSEWQMAIDEYKANGMSDKEAFWHTVGDQALSLGLDFLGGAISGGVMGGGGVAINSGLNAVQKNQAIKDHGQAIIDNGGTDYLKELALEVAGVKQDSEGGELTREGKKIANLAEKVEKKATPKNVGKLSAKLETTITEQNRTEIESALVDNGLTKREAKVAVKDIVGGELTTSEKSMIESDHFQTAIDAVLYGSDIDVSTNSLKLAEARLGKSVTTPTDSPSFEGNKSSVTENPTAKEIVAEGNFEVSEDGKTIVKETGKAVSVEEIVSNEGGKLMVKLDSGETVNASDLEFGTAGEALAYEMVANMGVNPKTAWGLVKAYDPSSGVKPQTFAIDMPLAYQYGKIGYAKGLERLNLTPAQRNTAYVLGRDDVKANGRTWSDTSRKTPETNKSKAAEDGIIYDGFELNEDSLTDIQKASLAGIRTIAKLSPALEIHITQSSVDENGKKYFIVNGKKQLAKNGVFRNGNEIYIDLNAGKGATGTMLYTVSHEVVHFIAENSYEDFKALADFLFEHYGENNVPVDSLIKREIDKLKKGYESEGKALPNEKVLYMKAYEEVVANAMSKMFADPTSYEKLAKLKSENFDLWTKIGEAIKHILNKLKSLLGIYEGRTPDAMAAHYVDDFSIEVYNKLQDLYLKGFVNAEANYEASIGSRNLKDFAEAKNTEGESLFQYKAMEADEDTYREMLKKWGKMTDSQISNLFLTIDNAMELIKDNLEALDYAWEADIDDRAFSPVKPNSDKLYQVSLDYSTLCRKRILQQTIIAHLQEALNKPLTREEGIAIRDALIALQEEGRQIEVACALCYVESARMKSPEQIKRFIDNREAVIKEFFAGKSGGDIKSKIKKAEDDVREKLHKENPNGIKGKDGETMLDPRTAKLNQLPKKYADEIRSAKKSAKQAYTPTAEEQRIIEVAKGMTVSDFTSPEGLENLAKNYPSLFDAYTSYVRNATKSKGIENDTWWRAGDSMQIGDVLIANMNRENGLRSQSWSDFQVIHILDYIASTIELATRETKEQAYTKVPDYAELMGKTGVMINLSLIPTAKFNGMLDYDSVEGMDYKRALELRDKYHATVGTICIGVDNVQIKMLLGDITIDYVIPYHKSGMSAAIRKLMHIPTWSQYEEYQSEKNLSRAEAEEQTKKYGVKLLDASDPNYHKGTSFSEWFDIKEAQQIAKMENANPSDKAKQKKYGVMYGGYMAMQNAANNYLKLCAERGISPKFSHEKADFTAEENYWKLLIDRKMVDNITGEVIEQQTIKPIFDEKEVMRILNDELERYPKVKADQDYAIRKVTEGMLSGKIKGGMSAKDIAKVMQTPVDNVTKTNIIASAESDELYSVDDFEEDSLDKYRQNSYNLYTTTNEYQREVTLNDKHSFARFLADETSEMADGDYKLLYIRCYDKIYCFSADGYMRGQIVHSKYVNKKKNKERGIDEYSRTWINKDREIASLWAEPVQGEQGGYEGDSAILGGRGRSDSYDTLSEDPSEHYTARYTERERQAFETKEEIERIVKKLREMYGLDDNKHSDGSMGDVLYSTDDDTDSITEADVEKSFEAIWDDIVESTHGKYKNVKDFLRNETDYEMVDYWSGMYDVLDEDVFDAIPFAKVEGLWNDGSDNWEEKWTLGDILEAYQNGTLHKFKLKSNVENQTETKTETAPKTWREKAESLRETLLEGLSLQGREEIPSIESLMSLENPELTLVRVIHNDYRREGKRYSLVHEEVGRLDEIAYQLRDLLKANEDKLFSAQDSDSVSNRSLLANALESVAQNDIERSKLAQYKEKIALIESEQAKLSEIRGKIKELSFAKGPRDTEAIKKLQFEANQTANRINTYDRQLLNLESTAALKGVLQREKELARRKEAQKGKEALAKYRERAAKTQKELLTRYQESLKKGIEGRRKTEMRHKIKDVVNELNQYLTKGTKEKHVPIELQKAVAEALDAVNMDTVGAEERIAKLQEELRTAKTLEDMKAITKKIERIQEMGGNLEAKLSRLKTAYDSIINSDDPLIANSHDDVISSSIDKVIEVVGDTPLRDMSLYQLEAVYDLYKMVLATIRNTNKAFKAAKGEEISTIANGVIAELIERKRKSVLSIKGMDKLSKFDWNNLKPIYAFERIGSANFTKVFKAVREGEDVWANDMSEARAFRKEQFEKYKYDSWDHNQRYGFTSTSGKHFELTLDQIMSLYAFSKRDQAGDHLKYGGFVFDGLTEVKEKKGKVVTVTYQLEDATAYNLSEEILAEIIGKLTPDQRAFADAMQDYLSTVMGEKGNEVSLALYDIKLFKEKYYFPLKSDTHYLAKAKEQAQGEVKIKNKGFTKETSPKAKNPIVLSSFMDVWAGHVNDMSMYHAFTLPLEDFYRVYNYHTPADEKMDMVSVGASLKNAHGQAAVNYIDQLLTDLNGGARSDPREFFGKSLVSNFKKASVMASLSVVVQQPTAIVRAMALVDAKYFAGKKVEKGKHKEMWAEVKKYAPVAVIKEMGYFDIGMGQGSVEWLNSNEYHGIKEKAKAFVKDGSYRDEVLSKLPALADEVAWVSIWNAVKRETVHTHKNLRPNSEEFLKVVGERFTEVVTKTQVYDSTLARSANMRSKSGMMKMWTAFMAEPTTSINMLQDAFRKGNKKYIVRALGAVYGSVILNSALVSLIYAMRDDDEDETFLEKYLSRLTTEIVDGINPLTYIPFVKDIWSIAQGFDVERADMSLITDAFDSLQQMVRVIAKDTSDMDEKEIAEHRKAFSEAILSITDSLSSFFGVPVKNVRRDINGVINAFNTIKKDITERDTTAGSLGDNILEDVKNTVPVWGWFPDESKGDKLYDAIIKGDTAYVDRIKNGYKDDKAYESAVRKALRENDPRIKEAAVARYSGRNDEYMRIASEIKAEGKFSQDTIVAAINAEISKLKPDKESEVSSPKYVTVDDYYNSVVNGDTGTARTIVDMLVKEKLEEGYLQVEAENSIATSFTTKVKEAYMDGEVTRSKAVSLLVSHGNKSNSEAEAEVKKCDFELKHDIPWSERARAYRLGKISKSTLISAVMDIEGETWEDAEAYVRFLDLEKNNPTIDITASDAASYFEHAEPAGIGIEMYLNYKDQTKGLVSDKDAKGNSISGSKKKKVMAVINSLPISSYQKDALYLAEGWAKDKLWEAPWH